MNDALQLVLLRFGAACAASVPFALLLALLLRRAAARWPALEAHRSVWLSAQAAVVLAFALGCAPLPRGAVVPALALPPSILDAAPGAAALDAAATAAAGAPDGAAVALPPAPRAQLALRVHPLDIVRLAMPWLPAAWCSAWLAGLAWHALARLRARRHWRHLLRHARILSGAELRALPALTPAQCAHIARLRLTVLATDLPLSPMLLGVLRPRLLLPAHLATLDPAQQRLIVEHELTHCRRADPLWLALSGALGLLFWFNRPLRRLDAGLREAVECGCDDAVLAGRDAGERRGYAAALVAQLRLQLAVQAPGHAGTTAFGNLGVAGRVQRMRAARPPRLSPRGRMLAGLGALGCALAGAALQPAFSSNPDSGYPAPAAPPAAAAAAPEPWRYPLDQVRVTALYGVRSPSVPNGQHGVDFAARRGTPVHAVSAGRVVEAAFNPTWGHYVRVEHGAGVSSLLIHLDRVDVAYGRNVAAGELLGASGASGRASGPHLHLEYWKDGRRLDPQAMLPDLSGRATPRALARRRQQGNPVPDTFVTISE
ncbi:peptidoglycan DD-metalloendopeptidase family protein [Massilia forsythiae]|uniref:Peptidoglycan DD-metalloendopeptidase family protein n=1 Tax=Massilia forsythiae TaxID=2728020 RepID=A0A7Z2ZUK8_9BURK|nr:M23/M56 family metallopeptidase [Massilia forsythiae]QJE02786.1 peptidoglycan DD-metalloendopeptidase family protein [Massilia forsythiae]